MSAPRFIPADEAKAMLEGSQEQHEWWPDVLTPVEESAHDLAHTVIAQAAQIKRLQDALRTASDLDTLMERGIITAEDMR